MPPTTPDIRFASRAWTLLVLALLPTQGVEARQQPLAECWGARPAAPDTFAVAGHLVVLRHSADTSEVEAACEAEILTAGGDVLWREVGFNTNVVAESGRDLDGDGSPDLLVGVDTGGGNRCCWGQYLLSFNPSFRQVHHFGAGLAWVPDSTGGTLGYELHPYYGLGPYMALTPYHWVVYRYERGKVTEATATLCPSLLHPGSLRGPGSFAWDRLTDDRLDAARRDGATDAGQETRVTAMSLVLQALYCQTPGTARTWLRAWPDEERASVLRRLTDALSRQGDSGGP